jgi:hypothetical protein
MGKANLAGIESANGVMAVSYIDPGRRDALLHAPIR